jgi:hypothetical protein
MMEETVTIPKAEHERLRAADAFLDALLAAGVDNWCGYDEAHRIVDGEGD